MASIGSSSNNQPKAVRHDWFQEPDHQRTPNQAPHVKRLKHHDSWFGTQSDGAIVQPPAQPSTTTSIALSIIPQTAPNSCSDLNAGPSGAAGSSGSKAVVKPANNDNPLKINSLLGTVFIYVGPQDLAEAARVNKFFYKMSNSAYGWRNQCIVQGFVPETIPAGLTHGQIFKAFYPSAIGKEAYRAREWEPEVIPPIPTEFIQRTYQVDPASAQGQLVKDTHQLVLTTDITITVDDNSPLMLDEQENLIVDPTKKDHPSEGIRRVLKVPMTANNFINLATVTLQNHDFPFKIVEFQYQTGGGLIPVNSFLDPHGNIRIKPHWSYQRKDVTCIGETVGQQQNAVRQAGREIVDVTDRLISNVMILAATHLPNQPKCDHYPLPGQEEEVETPITRPMALVMGKETDGSEVLLHLWTSWNSNTHKIKHYMLERADNPAYEFPGAGVAVGIPAGIQNTVAQVSLDDDES